MWVWPVFAPLSTVKILLIYQWHHTIYVLLCIYDTCVVNVHALLYMYYVGMFNGLCVHMLTD